jgi:hypothetical protein
MEYAVTISKTGMLFDVRVTAFDPQAAVDPVEALMRLFKIDRAFAREVVHRLPRVIKRGVPLDTARRLSQVLERIGARVEILVSERTEEPPAQVPAPAPQEQLDGARTIARDPVARGPRERGDLAGSPHNGAPHPSLARGAGRGLPPPSAAAVAQAPNVPSQAPAQQAGPAALAALVRRSIPQQQGRAEAASLPNMVSLPNPGLQEEAPNGQPISGVLEARSARALREQAASRASLPDPSLRDARRGDGRAALEVRKVDPRLVETHSEGPRPGQAFDSEMSSASLRSVLKQAAADDGALSGRVSLPMGSWSEPDNEESRVSAALGRASLPGGSMPDNAQLGQRPSQVSLPAPKPSVKEILSRRTLSPGERISRVPGDTIPSGVPSAPMRQQLALPTFNARGSSLGDDIEDLPEIAEQRRKLALFSWLLLLLASIASAGLFFALLATKVWARKRRRILELRELQASSLLVGPAQLPDLYNCVKQLAIRLEISPSPRLYVAERTPRKVQSFVQNNSLVIVMDAALLSSVARHEAGYIVQFALAHEMAAFALGQHGTVRSTLAELWAKIRKGDLLCADALAAKAMADKNEPARALASLLCGPELAHLVDLAELERQTVSQEQEGLAHRDASEDATFLLPRILHLRRAAAEARTPNQNKSAS